jgi:hypothetical protein
MIRAKIPAMLGRVRPPVAVAVIAALVAALVGVTALITHPGAAKVSGRADRVIIAGAPGLRWGDLTPTNTPTLWQLAGAGSVGVLTARSASRLTCPADGWLTLGAGNAAEWGIVRGEDPCVEVPAAVTSPDGIGGRVSEQALVVEHNRELAWGAQPGALAESVRCTVAVGRGAAVAAARPVGRVDRYVESLPADPGQLLTECPLSIVDLGTVAGGRRARAAAAARADAVVARLLAARPPGTLLILAGLADTGTPARLHVVIAEGPGYTSGWLASPSTGRRGYVQLFDLAPTALAALGEEPPARLFAGTAAGPVAGGTEDTAATVRLLTDADARAQSHNSIASRFLLVLALLNAIVLGLAVPMLRRARVAGRRGFRPVSQPVRRVAEAVLAAAGLAVPAALAADLVAVLAPGASRGSLGLFFALAWLVVLALSTGLVLAGPLRRHTLATAAAAGGIAAGIAVAGAAAVGGVAAGGWLQLYGVGGPAVLAGGRYSGLGPVGLGVFIAGLLLSAGFLAQQVARAGRPIVVGVAGCAGIVVVGSPYLGADPGGAVALTAGVSVAVVMASGGWLTVTRLLAAVAGGTVLIGALAAIDMSRPPGERGSLGSFLVAVEDGTAGLTARRASAANVVAAVTSPLTLFVLVGIAFWLFVLLQHWGGLKRLFALYPAIRAVTAGTAVAALLGGVANRAGLVVAGAATAVMVPLVTLMVLRALVHAGERTVVEGSGATGSGATGSGAAGSAPRDLDATRDTRAKAAATPPGVLP